MNEKKELLFLEKDVNNPIIKMYFKEKSWIPNPYSFEKENFEILHDEDILFEAIAITDLILFFIDTFNKSLSQKSKDLVKNRFAISSQVYYTAKLVFLKSKDLVKNRFAISSQNYYTAKLVFLWMLAVLYALFQSRAFLERERFISQNREVSICHVQSPHREVSVCNVHSPLDNISKGLSVSANAMLDHQEIVQLSQNEAIHLLLRLKGGGNHFLADPNPTYMPSTSNSGSVRETRRALPKPHKRILSYENRSKVSALPPLHSKSSLSKNRIDNRSTFIGPVDLSDVRNIKVEALEPSDNEINYLDYNIKHLMGIQDVKKQAILINNEDKAKGEQAMADVLTKEYTNLKKIKENLNISWREKDRQIKIIEERIRLEEEHQKYHLDNTFNRDRTTMLIPREPENTRYDGDLAITCQTYEDIELSEEEKKFLYSKYADLTSFICHHVAGEKSNKNTPSQREQFSIQFILRIISIFNSTD